MDNFLGTAIQLRGAVDELHVTQPKGTHVVSPVDVSSLSGRPTMRQRATGCDAARV